MIIDHRHSHGLPAKKTISSIHNIIISPIPTTVILFSKTISPIHNILSGVSPFATVPGGKKSKEITIPMISITIYDISIITIYDTIIIIYGHHHYDHHHYAMIIITIYAVIINE